MPRDWRLGEITISLKEKIDGSELERASPLGGALDGLLEMDFHGYKFR